MDNETFTPETCHFYPKSHIDLEGKGYELYRVHHGLKKPEVVESNHQFRNPAANFGGFGWFPCNADNLAILKKFIPWLNPLLGDF
ncbi:MAG: hypothetical protein LHW44_02655 [Candidatus Cloacimonetes bacterium]|nr:hypothetical protein [Candidatus Cloacimonadota bacterium]